MLPHNRFCSHNRTVGSQILYKSTRNDHAEPKVFQSGKITSLLSHAAQMLAPHIVFDHLQKQVCGKQL